MSGLGSLRLKAQGIIQVQNHISFSSNYISFKCVSPATLVRYLSAFSEKGYLDFVLIE